jgi:hypothetical protein
MEKRRRYKMNAFEYLKKQTPKFGKFKYAFEITENPMEYRIWVRCNQGDEFLEVIEKDSTIINRPYFIFNWISERAGIEGHIKLANWMKKLCGNPATIRM